MHAPVLVDSCRASLILCIPIDLGRATVECDNVETLDRTIGKLSEKSKTKKVFIMRIKNRLDPGFDPMEAGGYRDVLINLSFEEEGHQVELQLNLSAFVIIKNSGGHAAYTAARMLQAFDPNVVDYIGAVDDATCSDLSCGLTKRLTAIHQINKPLKFVAALESRSAQVVELKILNVQLEGDMKNSKWLEAVFDSLKSTLHTLQIDGCGLEGAACLICDFFAAAC